MNPLYFDHCASTPPLASVVRTVSELMTLHYANSGALHRSGAEALKLVERARTVVANALGARPGEVVFTSGGTESNNLALKGTVAKSRKASKHIVTTAIEHASVFACAQQLEAAGVRATYLPVDERGIVSVRDVEAAIADDTALVSVMHVNNETGAIQPIEEIGRLLEGYPQVRFHVDGVQAIGKMPVRWREWGVDLYAASAHKFQGPKGVGFLLVREGVELDPLLIGGGQEDGLRSGTHNLPGIVAGAQALRLAVESTEARRERMYALRRRLIGHLRDIPELHLNGSESETASAPQVVNVSYPGMRPEVIVHMLEQHGVLVSTQSACSSKSLKPSRVLLAMGMDAHRASGSIRISFGDEHGTDEIDALAERLKTAVAKLKPLERT
ncbi:cysteine desulfurase family protein [Cohnella sp. REN36]|uniref:cysteine desulfurase family protein n=1 Tax=Cohnella sp. REN36 TaxID=2887347 RepID=UPI001D159EEB|nr:cysteine desulfurase family protein [Cohnella sp. REN36]MCC3372825.1 cysteine desulfurase [Cohnella sp. REN36]